MRKNSLVVAGCFLIAIATLHAGCASKPPKWRPISGAKVTPWEQTQAICDPVRQTEGEATAMAQYRACMAKHGWSDRAPSREDRDRDDELKREAQQLEDEIRQRRTKNALTLLAGVPPKCQAGDPGTEICSWRWTWKSRTQPISAPIQMTCVLPRDGKPREEKSCRVDPGY